MKEEEVYAVELIKEWMTTNNAAYLAKEGQIVFWGKAKSTIDDDEWIMYSMREAINIFKSTILPFGLMKYCTAEVVMVAAMELGRSFIYGVHSDVQTLPQVFNFNVEALRTSVKELDANLELMSRIIRNFEMAQINVLIVDVGSVLDTAFTMLGLTPLSREKRNILMRRVLERSGCMYKEKNYKNRYMYKGKVHAVIKHKLAIGLEKLEEEQIKDFALMALRGSIAAQKYAVGEMRELLGVSI